jgi:hypothetical protein
MFGTGYFSPHFWQRFSRKEGAFIFGLDERLAAAVGALISTGLLVARALLVREEPFAVTAAEVVITSHGRGFWLV